MNSVSRAFIALAVLASLLIMGQARPASATLNYAGAVLADSPGLYWRLGESSGSVAADASGNGKNGTYYSTTGFGAPGAIPSSADTALGPESSTSRYINAATQSPASNVFTQELWFKTITTTGGGLISFSNSTTLNQSSHDRHLWMGDNGRIYFGVYPGAPKRINSSVSYNDARWHMATATLSPAGMRLYIDGALVAQDATTTTGHGYTPSGNGYWRAGTSSVGSWAGGPTTNGFDGSIDEVAIWPTVALSDAQIAAHFHAAQRTVSVTVEPALTFSVSAHSGACNGQAQSTGASASGNAVSLGHVSASVNAVGAQDLTVTSNASGGFVVYARNTGPMTNGNGHNLNDVASTPATFPSPGTEAVGVTTDDADLTAFVGNKWGSITTSNRAVSQSTTAGPVNADAACVGYQVGISGTTRAGSYTTTVIYTAVPVF